MVALLEQLGAVMRRFPELAVFLTLGLGYYVGKIKVMNFGLGSVVGTLVVGMIIGQAHVEIPTFARSLFFLLFMFATGYQVGPQFIVSIRRGGLQMVVLALVFAFTGLGVAVLTAWFLKLDAGFSGGLVSGALTQSSVIGTASDAIKQLPLPEERRTLLISHVPVADAVTYVYGTVGVTILLTKVFPAIMRVKLRDESKKFEKELGGLQAAGGGPVMFQPAIRVDIEAFRLDLPGFVGAPISAFEAAAGEDIQVPALRRGGRLVFKPGPSFTLEAGDTVVLSGPREELLKVGALIGEQVVDPAAMEVPFQSRTIIVTSRRVVGAAIRDLRSLGEKRGKGLHLRRITRQGLPVPILPGTIIQRGDAMELVGAAEDLDRATPLIGVADVPTDRTNFISMGLTIAIGVLVGAITIRLGGVPVGLGTGGGALVAGLAFGWLQSYYPRLGRIPAPSVWLMQNLGLNAFVAMVGIAAGPHAVEAMKTAGLQLLFASVVVATIPHAVSFVLGRYIFRLNAGQLMGALAGAGTVTAALQAVVDESDSSVPVLGYTVPFAINNILLTAWGPVVVAASQLWSA